MNREPQPSYDPQQKLTLRVFFRGLWRAMTTNLPLKLLSAAVAVLIWSLLISSDTSLTRDRTFEDVPVAVTGAETLRANRMIVLEDVQELVPTVDLVVAVPQTNYDRATGESYNPRVDLSRITEVGVQEVPITASATSSVTYGTVTSITPSTVTVTVEEYGSRSRIPVTVVRTGELAEGLWLESATADPSQITINGPLSLIDRDNVRTARVDLDLSELVPGAVTQRLALPFTLYNQDNVPVESPLIEVYSNAGVSLDSIVVEATVYPTRAITVDTTTAVTGVLPEGYELARVTIEPSSVTLAADQTLLDTTGSVYVTTPVDLSRLTASTSASSTLRRNTDIKHYSADEVTINVEIREALSERTFYNLPIVVEGLDELLYSGRLGTSSAYITVKGPYFALQNLTAEDIELYVDVSDWSQANSSLPIQAHIESMPEATYTISPETVRYQRWDR